jgi:hypothetical protein
MALTIDPATKRFILDTTSVTAKSIYAAWVDWVALSDNSKYLPAFRTAGGDDLGGGLSIPPYYFLTNGWRVRPMEANQTLVIDGNLFVDGGGDPIVSTLGVYQVLVKSVVPVQAQGISTSGGSGGGGATASDIWAYGTRELTSAIPTAAAIAAAVLATLQANTIPVNMTQVKGQTIHGAGSEADPWGP